MLEWASTKGSKSVEFQSLLCELKYQKDYGYSVVFDTQRRYVRFWKSVGVHRVFNRPDDDDDDDDDDDEDDDDDDHYRRCVSALDH